MGWERKERARKTPRVLGLTVGRMELPLAPVRGSGTWGYQDLALELSSLKCLSDTPYRHTFSFLSQPRFPHLYNGRWVKCLGGNFKGSLIKIKTASLCLSSLVGFFTP